MLTGIRLVDSPAYAGATVAEIRANCIYEGPPTVMAFDLVWCPSRRAALGAVLRWPFERRAGRRYPDTTGANDSTSTNATDRAIGELLAQASGKVVDATSLAISESCIGLWERCLASATVEPMSNRTSGLTPAVLALIGRGLAVKGNLVCRITVEGAAVRLWPAADFDIQGETDPATWTYRPKLPGPSSTHTVMVPADGVVHFRTGALASAPWRGIAPLKQVPATAALATFGFDHRPAAARLRFRTGRRRRPGGRSMPTVRLVRCGGESSPTH